ncbi:hypothetical protein [Bacillus mycoides]|uniref:hypothetical protein n=1 Tax=Bacillus mycoides TaxID=1405 RepID=UPI003A802D1B
MKLSREMTGQRGFTFADKMHLKARLAILNAGLASGIESKTNPDVLYRIKLVRTTEGSYNSIILEFLFQSGSRVRVLLCNGCSDNDKGLFARNYQVRPDRILDLSTYKVWKDVKKVLHTKLIESEDARGNANFYRTRIER